MTLIIVLLLGIIRQPISIIMMVIIAHPKCVPLCHRLSLHLILLFLPHSMDLFLQELHLLKVAVPYLVLLPFLVLAALLYALSINVEAVEVLHHLQLVVEVDLAVVLAAGAEPWVGEVLDTVEQVLEIVAQGVELAGGLGQWCLLFVGLYAALAQGFASIFFLVPGR